MKWYALENVVNVYMFECSCYVDFAGSKKMCHYALASFETVIFLSRNVYF